MLIPQNGQKSSHSFKGHFTKVALYQGGHSQHRVSEIKKIFPLKTLLISVLQVEFLPK